MCFNSLRNTLAFSTFTMLVSLNNPALAATLKGTVNFGVGHGFPSGVWDVHVDLKKETGHITSPVGIKETVHDVPSMDDTAIFVRTKNVSDRIWNWFFFESGDVILRDNTPGGGVILKEVDDENTNYSVIPHPIPEPSSMLGLLSLGIIGAGVTLQSKVKQSRSIEKEVINVNVS